MTDVDVAIVGAGAAGLSAARFLLGAGRTVAVFEARDRIGGRVWTEPNVFGTSVDHGASFIHAWPDNPWTHLARRLGFKTVIDRRRRFLFVDGQQAPPAMFDAFMAARQEALNHVLAVEREPADRSIADGLDIQGPHAAEARASLAPWLLGADNEDASALDFARGVSGEDRLVPRGYGRLVEAYGRGLPVHVNSRVTDIRATGRSVQLLANGSSLHAAKVLVTVPIGVLAAGHIRFTPDLDDRQQRAVQGLPMGLLAKIVMVFDGDPFGLGDGFYLHRNGPTEDAALYFCRPAGSNQVVAFVGGRLARRLEEEGEAAAADFALTPLRELFGKSIDRRLRGVRHTRWGTDPFALGSYSVAKPGASDLRRAFDQPHADHIHFAGEAAAPDGWAATVAGASMSGRRAAERILRAL